MLAAVSKCKCGRRLVNEFILGSRRSYSCSIPVGRGGEYEDLAAAAGDRRPILGVSSASLIVRTVRVSRQRRLRLLSAMTRPGWTARIARFSDCTGSETKRVHPQR